MPAKPRLAQWRVGSRRRASPALRLARTWENRRTHPLGQNSGCRGFSHPRPQGTEEDPGKGVSLALRLPEELPCYAGRYSLAGSFDGRPRVPSVKYCRDNPGPAEPSLPLQYPVSSSPGLLQPATWSGGLMLGGLEAYHAASRHRPPAASLATCGELHIPWRLFVGLRR